MPPPNVDKIIDLILSESDHVKNPNLVSRIMHVHMQITEKLMEILEDAAEYERIKKPQRNPGPVCPICERSIRDCSCPKVC